MHRSWENCRTAAADVGSLCPVLLQPTLCTEQLWVKQYVFLEDTQRSRHITGKKVSAIIELCSYAIHTPCARAVQLNCVVLRVDRQCKCVAPPTWEYHREYAAELCRAARMYNCRSAGQRRMCRPPQCGTSEPLPPLLCSLLLLLGTISSWPVLSFRDLNDFATKDFKHT